VNARSVTSPPARIDFTIQPRGKPLHPTAASPKTPFNSKLMSSRTTAVGTTRLKADATRPFR
jgi:hypothetical protein